MSGVRPTPARTNTKIAPGYSGKPLWQKLGLKAGLRVWLRNPPAAYWTWCGFDAADVELAGASARSFDFGHLFVTTHAQLKADITAAARRLEPGGMLWISWPKKSSGVTSDLSEDTLREVALPLGLVDVKVCAVSEVWSGLKFCWRRVAAGSPASTKKSEKSA